MKISTLFFMVGLAMFANYLSAQELILTMKDPDKTLLTETGITVNATIHNNTNSTITVFGLSFKEYGGIAADWTLSSDESQKSLNSQGLDSHSTYSERYFHDIAPGQSYKWGGRLFNVYKEGNYELTFKLDQDGATMKSTHAANKKSFAKAQELTKFNLEASIQFNVQAKPQRKMGEVDNSSNISYEELQHEKLYNLKDAFANPEKVYKLSASFSIPDKDYSEDIENIGKLKNIQYLSISTGANDLVIPSSWEDFNLMELDLRSTDGTIEFPVGFAGQGNLKKAVIYLEGQIVDFVKDHKGLTELRIKLAEDVRTPAWIGELTELEVLEVKHANGLPSSFESLTKLKELFLSYGMIGVPQYIYSCPNLETLHLAKSEITELPEDIAKLKNLVTLDLTSNQLTGLPSSISDLQKLESIRMGGNQLSSFPSALAKINSLRIIDVSSNKIPSLTDGISDLPNLTYFNVKGNSMKKNKEYKKLEKNVKKFVQDKK